MRTGNEMTTQIQWIHPLSFFSTKEIRKIELNGT